MSPGAKRRGERYGALVDAAPFGIPGPVVVVTGEKPGDESADNLDKGMMRRLTWA